MVTCIEILHSLIKGCYSNSVESLPTVVKNTIFISSVGMCQEICHHENSAMFAVKVGSFDNFFLSVVQLSGKMPNSTMLQI